MATVFSAGKTGRKTRWRRRKPKKPPVRTRGGAKKPKKSGAARVPGQKIRKIKKEKRADRSLRFPLFLPRLPYVRGFGLLHVSFRSLLFRYRRLAGVTVYESNESELCFAHLFARSAFLLFPYPCAFLARPLRVSALPCAFFARPHGDCNVCPPFAADILSIRNAWAVMRAGTKKRRKAGWQFFPPAAPCSVVFQPRT